MQGPRPAEARTPNWTTHHDRRSGEQASWLNGDEERTDGSSKPMTHEKITPAVQPTVVPACIVSPTKPTSGMGLLFESIVGRNDATRPDGAVLVLYSKSTSAFNGSAEGNKVRRVGRQTFKPRQGKHATDSGRVLTSDKRRL